MTVKEYTDILNKMRSVYPYDDEKTYIRVDLDLKSASRNVVTLKTMDERTGITVVLTQEAKEYQEYGNGNNNR